ncbi:MAG: RNA polymerase sigma factor [Burkholderiales bacterium]|nr:RNA polymerase sigma factor [Burkholderiales bacterium]
MTAATAAQDHARDPDSELARHVASGDAAAFAALMRRYNRTLFRAARAILRDDAEAEDALQDAYIRAYASMGSFRGEARLSTWLVRIVANEALARRRRRQRRAEVVPLHVDAGTGAAPEADPGGCAPDGPERAALRAEMCRLIERKIDALPDDFRLVFVLRAIEEFSVEETAAALAIPQATVRTRFFRARSLLREALSQELDLAFDGAFGFAGARCDRIVACVLARLRGGGVAPH